eukprot:Gb_35038 [translate_table: standard]
MMRFNGHCRQTILAFYFVVVIAYLLVGMSKADLTMCNNATIYTNSSTFVSNLNRVLDELAEKTSETGFNTSSYGRSPNAVYGLLQCRGDLSQQECYNCSQKAKMSIRQSCGNDIGGRGWFDTPSYKGFGCFLRYENYSFISTLDTLGYYLWNLNNISNPDEFDHTVRSLLHNLSVKASSPTNKAFAAESSIDSLFRTINGMVQCWRDISVSDCQSCLSTAIETLFGYSHGKQGGVAVLGSCFVRYETYPFFDSSSSPPSPQPPAESPRIGINTPPSRSSATISKNQSNKLPIILGSVGGLLLALILLCLIGMRLKHKFSVFYKPISQRYGGDVHEDVSGSLLSQEQIMYDLETLQVATGNFHQDNKLGEGGFGPVYKGKMSDGREIAVKKLSLRSAQGKTEFMNEVKLVENIRHRNLVRLLGCCTKGPERLLVYEYLPNKSLDTFLFHAEKRKHLNWQKRYNIILGVAHSERRRQLEWQERYNIILGIAQYAMRGQLSVKADVYSFGVLLLEIVSGRKNTDSHLPLEAQNILEWTWRLYKRGQILDVIDGELVRSCPQEQALRCIHVGLLCTQADPALRPPISNVILMMSSNSVTLGDPTKPVFVNVSHSHNSESTSGNYEDSQTDGMSGASATTSRASSPSINEASISEMEPR